VSVGTLEEVVDLLSRRRLELHAKPVVFYNPNGFWRPLFDLLQRTVDARRLGNDRVLDGLQRVPAADPPWGTGKLAAASLALSDRYGMTHLTGAGQSGRPRVADVA
jgi:Possible lysine decarboxylase